ncbi:MAG: hypothetical protein K6G03_12390 [Lachnospiraceae bacterium]|nr:hypothetical protein [Lachnospiraceae bacterium]
MNSLRDRIKDPYKIFGLAAIAAVVIIYVVLIMHNGYRFLNSDDSSELALARILADQHSILTKDWFYSSELRVLNTNLFFAPMFYIFKSWSAVRAAGGSLLLIAYVASYLWIPYAWKYETKWFYLTAFVLIMPYAEPWQFFGLKMYYIPHVAISFVSFALLGHIFHAENNRKKTAYIALLGLFAFAAGLGGVRSVEYTYIPLFLTAFLIWFVKKSGLIPVAVAFGTLAASGVGYIVNGSVLSKIYQYHSYGNVSFIRFSFEKLEWAVDAVLASFGYVIGEYFISFGGICNCLAFMMMILFFMMFPVLFLKRNMMSVTQEYMYWFATVTFLMNTFVMILGQNDEYADRYITIGMVPAVMLIDLFYRIYIEGKTRDILIGVAILAVFITLGIRGYLGLLHIGANGERLGYISYLTENGYDYGYATFWNANITTEMSDGRINMTSLDPNAEDLRIFEWLTDKTLTEKEHDKYFLVLDNNEKDKYTESEPVYQDEYYSVYDIERQCIKEAVQ